jgi:hypothetical protein
VYFKIRWCNLKSGGLIYYKEGYFTRCWGTLKEGGGTLQEGGVFYKKEEYFTRRRALFMALR